MDYSPDLKGLFHSKRQIGYSEIVNKQLKLVNKAVKAREERTVYDYSFILRLLDGGKPHEPERFIINHYGEMLILHDVIQMVSENNGIP